jgi:hypothetical protein
MRYIYSMIISRRGRLGAATLLLICYVAVSSACGGCDNEEDPSAGQTDKEQAPQKDEQADQKTNSMSQKREVFGLPLPPNVVSMVKKGPRVHVKSAMSLDEIEAFFETRLTDYELLKPRSQLRFIGLRDFMPEIYAYGSGDYTFVVYRPGSAPEDQAKGTSGTGGTRAKGVDDDSSRAGVAAGPEPINQRKHGEKVLDRTSDGKLLAPGARWGVAYTPPPGSPLDQKRHRSNFGRPYGEWVLH